MKLNRKVKNPCICYNDLWMFYPAIYTLHVVV